MQWSLQLPGLKGIRALRGLRQHVRLFVSLRPYQEHCLHACVRALDSGSTRIGISLPTGSGKTTVFLSLLSRIPSPESVPGATKALVIVNSIELAQQAANQARLLFPNWSVEIEQGTKHHASGLADITVATYQTLLQSPRIAKFDPNTLKAIIIDEAHHAAAPSYRRLLSRFDANIESPDPDFLPPSLKHTIPIIGFSATFSRHDGLALGSVFEQIVYHRDFLEMIKEQWLCDVRFTTVRAQLNLKDVTINTRTGDFNPTGLAHVINTDTINRLVVQSWIDRAGRSRKSTLVFCVNLEHVRALTQAFRNYGIDARYVYAKTPTNERKQLVDAFKAGEFPVLINCAVLTEGADIPNIDCVLIARPTRSQNIFAQMIGRGMRLSPNTGKTDCRIIDFVDSTSRVSGVVAVPTLFGLDPASVDIDGEADCDITQKAAAEKFPLGITDDIPQPRSVTYTDYDDPFSLKLNASGSPHIATLSTNAWVGCGDDIYVLECLGKGHIRIEPAKEDEQTEPHFQAWFAPASLDRETAQAFKLSPFFRSRKIVTAPTLSAAVRACDTYARTKVIHGPMVQGLLRTAKWRKTLATDSQKSIIAKRWQKRPASGGLLDGKTNPKHTTLEERLARMTKGEAANIITRLKHGAQARYDKKVKAAVKAQKVVASEEARRARYEVKVGPMHRV
ncbi:P-loop containing nucleoside triphosphate hydrolase protein [Pleurotus eryngii]|uniref:P-loop containing nucleoside triphosphate hydrolase protein n=1 Tax=Pleurotus eryngii TaxID=5323 RepID=A0A9P6DG31_PLEER|nr:P-loop containing nucleoside triphosphate hydrolase protein [Pleurotus eryngii]